MGWKIERSAEKMCFGFCWAHDIWKNSMRHWTNTNHGLASPLLILTSQFNGKSVYHVPKCEPPLVCSSTLNYLQLKFFFSMRSSKIASHFKEMQILAFFDPVGSRQTILENTTDHLRNSHTGMALFGVTGDEQKKSIIIKKLVLKLMLPY